MPPSFWQQVKLHFGNVRAPYGALLVATILTVWIGSLRLGPWSMVPCLVLLAFGLGWVDDRQRRFGRNERGDAKLTPIDPKPIGSKGTVTLGARLAFDTGLLVIWLVIAWFGLKYVGGGNDIIFFTAAVSVLLAWSSTISEIRKWTAAMAYRTYASWGLKGVGACLLVAAATVPFDGPWPQVALVGVVGGAFGTSLASEAVIKDEGKSQKVRVCVGLAVLVGICLAWRAIIEVGAIWVLVALAASLVLAIILVSDSSALSIVMVFGLVVLLATSNPAADPNQEIIPTGDDHYFVVLGDSYTSGEGGKEFLRGTNTQRPDPDDDRHVNDCRQAKTAWGFQLAEKPPRGVPSKVVFLGCSGADTENISSTRMAGVGGPAELALYEEKRKELGRPPDFVILGVGGNDAGFSKIGMACVGPGSCASVGDQFVHQKDKNKIVAAGDPAPLEQAVADIDAAYDRIDQVEDFKGIPIIVTSYPIPITTEGPCPKVLLDQDERKFVVKFVTDLNVQIEALARKHGYRYLGDISTSLKDERRQLCEPKSGLNFINPNTKDGNLRDSMNPENWIHNDFHPNAGGHDAMYRAAARWFELEGPLRRKEPEPGAAPQLGTYADACSSRKQSCLVDGDWQAIEIHDAYQRAIIPALVMFAGSTQVMLAGVAVSRRKNLSSFNLVRLAWHRGKSDA